MEFEWDEAKRLLNLEKHNLDIIDVQVVFDGRPEFSAPSPRFGEERFATKAVVDGQFVIVIWTKRTKIRLISARRARGGERRKYRELYG